MYQQLYNDSQDQLYNVSVWKNRSHPALHMPEPLSITYACIFEIGWAVRLN